MSVRALLFILFIFTTSSAVYADVTAPEGSDCKKEDGLKVASNEFQSFITSYISQQKDFCTAETEQSSDELDFDFEFDESPVKANNACSCLLERYQNELPEEIAQLQSKHDLFYKRSLGKLLESNFMETSLNLEQTANGLENRGYDTSKLSRLGGTCNPLAQLGEIKSRCGGDNFDKKLQEYFAVSSIGELGKKLEGHKSAIRGEGEGTGCLNVFENDSVRLGELLNAPDAQRKINQLRAFLNVDMESVKDNPAYKNMSPISILGKMKGGDVKQKLLFKFVTDFPMLKAMLQSKDALKQLQKMVNQHWNKKENPIAFFDAVLGGDGNQNDFIYENMKKQCNSFKQKLEVVFCKKLEEPFVVSKDGLFEERFPLAGQEGDTIEKAYLCYADSFAKKGENSIDQIYQKLKAETSNDFINEPDGVSQSLRQKNELFSKDLCIALECQDPLKGREGCVKLDPMRSATDFLEGPMCKENPERGYPISQCKEPILSQYLALHKYQERRTQLMSEMVEIPNPNATPDEKGNVATIKVARERASFSSGFWKQDVPATSNSTVRIVNHSNDRGSDRNAEGETLHGGVGSSGRVTRNGFSDDGDAEKAQRMESFSADKTFGSDLPARRKLPRGLDDSVPEATHRVIERSSSTSTEMEEDIKRLENNTSKVVEKAERLSNIAQEKQAENRELQDRINRLNDEIANIKSDVPESQATDNQGSTTRHSFGSQVPNIPTSVVTDAMNEARKSRGVPLSDSSAGGAVGPGASTSTKSTGKVDDSKTKDEKNDDQVLTLTLEDLPTLESESLEKQGIDPEKGFTLELKAEGKVHYIPVRLIKNNETVMYAPPKEMLTKLERENPELVERMKQSPIFVEYFDFLAEELKRKLIRAAELNRVLSKK